MPAEPRPIEQAPLQGRQLLGALLGQRRAELGYTHRPAFARERLPLTPQGNLNTRLLADLEEAYRDNFPEVRLRQLAQAYLVTYDSVVAVAHGRARALVPLAAAPDATVTELPPMTGRDRVTSDREYFRPIADRRALLARQGIMDPSGAQMFGEGTEDARTWDGRVGRSLSVYDRMWLIADLRRREAGRDNGSVSAPAPEGV